MSRVTEATRYWEKKILVWESRRYSPLFLWNPFSWTVRRRLFRALALFRGLSPSPASVLELGCGSGLFAAKIICPAYLGVDIAGNAVELARERVSRADFVFQRADALEAAHQSKKFSLAVFLGLTDWLTEEELEQLLQRLASARLLFSFTESRVLPRWHPYRFYRALIDYKHGDYFARTYEFSKIESLLKQSGYRIRSCTPVSPLDPGRLVVAEK